MCNNDVVVVIYKLQLLYVPYNDNDGVFTNVCVHVIVLMLEKALRLDWGS